MAPVDAGGQREECAVVGQGVSIDRRVFKKLRRPRSSTHFERLSASRDRGMHSQEETQRCGQAAKNDAVQPCGLSDHSAIYDDVEPREWALTEHLPPLAEMSHESLETSVSEAARTFEGHGCPRTPSRTRPTSVPCRHRSCSVVEWEHRSPCRDVRKRSDPVARGAQMRALWSKDSFLQSSGRQKFDLRDCGRPITEVMPERRWSNPLIPSYTPPHEKRRDHLRLRVRQQMLA